ncbi:SDR family NAD(P)-dependent oxidoreductase [Streptomyces katrae]|uniref:3-oxoacyl-ACP reductase n=1 Tax=Streptomyces katrae TaxID=68223 RepID=A0A0F4IVZ6_9ACTN|nr:SDR family oxidoreductase [Streptomyces katrae]KJY25628.1 3-oxoacyl-ACP reductase [Streptomyces katrae]
MDLGLEGRVAVVTGASRGIGLAIVRALAGEGALVVAGARHSSAELDALVERGGVRLVRVDLAEAGGARRLVAAAGDRIDVLVNNVGSASARPSGFLGVTDEQWQQAINLNLFAAVRVTREVLPLMLERGSGSIVNICSVNSVDPMVIDYSVGKAALANFSKGVSKEVGGRGIRVNTVSPGPVETDLWLAGDGVAATVSRATGMTPREVAAQAAGATVTGRFSKPAEVADVVLMLASDRTGNVTGSDITIDGGFLTTW